ncbi:probable 2-oxoglutarate-dependent dioxygenase AOP1 [Telopea speciosissima]|uniref:probable 2-oxoglutarate-dependent dioxygenase AOP1 n=1 Tax=Telopea speciosissima TaxID=54955 RepID=UPI001CC6AF64|nr:probable 2-oxoglutarate-dependent dioxygenase AOP1 [Telopea speciosissima]
MGFDSCEGEVQIPYIDLTKEQLESKQGNEEWKELCGKVREACEEYGCFMVGYDGIPTELREEMFMAMKDLFDLPVETKQKNSNPQPTRGYRGNSGVAPLYESLGVDDAHCLDPAQAFTQLMWPHGNPAFCQTMKNMSEKMHELEQLIRRMILESYGMPTYFNALAETTHPVFRMIKYNPPPANDEAGLGLLAHTDKSFLSILSQDQVKGFELLTKQGHWLQLAPLQGSFLVVVGEMFKAWSNGRLHAVEHRVVMRGEKERYSCVLFAIPKDGEVVEVPSELVDDDHPLLFRPFNYIDYIYYCLSNFNITRNTLEIYSGV